MLEITVNSADRGHGSTTQTVFTARCYAERVASRGYEIACRLSVRLSVCDV